MIVNITWDEVLEFRSAFSGAPNISILTRANPIHVLLNFRFINKEVKEGLSVFDDASRIFLSTIRFIYQLERCIKIKGKIQRQFNHHLLRQLLQQHP
jgi:hypothetical protein